MTRIEIYTGPGCAHCETAKALLRDRGHAYEEHDVSDPAVMATLRERLPRVRALPQIFADGDHIGNDQDLRLWLERA